MSCYRSWTFDILLIFLSFCKMMEIPHRNFFFHFLHTHVDVHHCGFCGAIYCIIIQFIVPRLQHFPAYLPYYRKAYFRSCKFSVSRRRWCLWYRCLLRPSLIFSIRFGLSALSPCSPLPSSQVVRGSHTNTQPIFLFFSSRIKAKKVFRSIL
jgi:hypothetical protein